MMVRDFQRVIGDECLDADAGARGPPARCGDRLRGRRLATRWASSIPTSRIRDVQADRRRGGGRRHRERHATRRRSRAGTPGVLHGNRTYLLQDANGQIIETHSVSAGLDYPGVGPEHAWLKDTGRAEYVVDRPTTRRSPRSTTAAASRASFRRWSPRTRCAYATKLAPTLREGQDPARQPLRAAATRT